MIKIRSANARKIAAQVFAEHDPEFLAYLQDIAAVFGPLASIGYSGPAEAELLTRLTEMRNAA